jgi:hypothetical protein
MKGDVVAAADCVNPGAKMLVESVIGTVTAKKGRRERERHVNKSQISCHEQSE